MANHELVTSIADQWSNGCAYGLDMGKRRNPSSRSIRSIPGGEFLTTGKTVRHAALASKRCGHLCVGNRAPTVTRRRNNPTRRNLANLTAAMAAIHA